MVKPLRARDGGGSAGGSASRPQRTAVVRGPRAPGAGASRDEGIARQRSGPRGARASRTVLLPGRRRSRSRPQDLARLGHVERHRRGLARRRRARGLVGRRDGDGRMDADPGTDARRQQATVRRRAQPRPRHRRAPRISTPSGKAGSTARSNAHRPAQRSSASTSERAPCGRRERGEPSARAASRPSLRRNVVPSPPARRSTRSRRRSPLRDERTCISVVRVTGIALPDEARALIQSDAIAHVVTLDEDGGPQVTAASGRARRRRHRHRDLPDQRKLRNLRRDPRVALSIPSSTMNAWGLLEYLVVYGTARVTEGGGPEVLQDLRAHIPGSGRRVPELPRPATGIRHEDHPPERLGGVGTMEHAGVVRRGFGRAPSWESPVHGGQRTSARSDRQPSARRR